MFAAPQLQGVSKKKSQLFKSPRFVVQSERKDDGAEAAPEAVANGEGGKEPTNTGSFVYIYIHTTVI